MRKFALLISIILFLSLKVTTSAQANCNPNELSLITRAYDGTPANNKSLSINAKFTDDDRYIFLIQ